MELCLFYTDVGDDKVALQLAKAIKVRWNRPSSQVYIRHCRTTADLLDVLSRVDIVVASRLHAVILAHVCTLPTLAISYERKVLAHMNDMGQHEFCLDFHGIMLDDLSSRFDALICSRSNVEVVVSRAIEERRQLLTSQYLRVFCPALPPAA
jgi:polysaccharide pyruvyl transferase WcaK-like protein